MPKRLCKRQRGHGRRLHRGCDAGGLASRRAGIQKGDVIVAINNKNIHAGDDLINLVTATPVGNSVNVSVLRDGKRDNYKVVVGNMAQVFPDQFGAGGQKEESRPDEGTSVSFGMTIMPLTDRQRENMDLKEKVGVRVAEVEPNSFAEDLRLAPGDVILSIGYVSKGHTCHPAGEYGLKTLSAFRRISSRATPSNSSIMRQVPQQHL